MERHDRYLHEVLRLTLAGAIDWYATDDDCFAADMGGTTVHLTGDRAGTWAATRERDTREPAMRSADRSDLLLVMDLLRYRLAAGQVPTIRTIT